MNFPSRVILLVFIMNSISFVLTLLCSGIPTHWTVFWKLPLVHLELLLVHAKSPWSRHNFEMQIAPGSRRLISRLIFGMLQKLATKRCLLGQPVYWAVSQTGQCVLATYSGFCSRESHMYSVNSLNNNTQTYVASNQISYDIHFTNGNCS